MDALQSKSFNLQDCGPVVRVAIPFTGKSSDLDVQSSTTALSIRDKGGDILLSVPQLWSTVEASRTTHEVRDGKLTLSLHKHDRNEQWKALAYQEAQAATRPEAERNTGDAMAAREQVKQLFEAAVSGNIERIKQVAPAISSEGLSSVKDGNGRTALHFAAQAGQMATAEYLLESEGMDVNAQDDKGETPLAMAAGAGHLNMVSLLLKHGAHASLAYASQPQPVHRAAAAGSLPIVRALLEGGADIEAPSATGTPLLWASGSGQHEVVAELLARNANPNALADEGVSALLMAAARGGKLISRAVEQKHRRSVSEEEGKVAYVSCSAGDGDMRTVQALAQSGANPNLAAQGGVTALHAAAEGGDLQMAKFLLKAGADPDAEDTERAKPIHAAAAAGATDVVKHLLTVTKPREGEEWTLEALMADTSSSTSISSHPQIQDEAICIPEPEDYDLEGAASCKRAGDEAFVANNFKKAVDAYTDSLKHDTHNHLAWANRSAAHLRQGDAAQALTDAQKARTLKPEYMKGWYREGQAAKALEKFEEAANAFYQAFALEPTNEEVAQAFQAAIAAGREQHARQQALQQAKS